MEKFGMICPTFRRDMERFGILVNSVKKHNKDNIPFYVILPNQDVDLFKNKFGEDLNYVPEEEILHYDNKNLDKIKDQNWILQQVIKSQFWRLDLCENTLLLDSDNYFITEFKLSDFMYNDDIPYTLMHECKDLLQFTSRRGMDFVHKSFAETRLPVMEIFGRKGRLYDFGPTPTLWSRKVWEGLKNDYQDKNNLSFSDLILSAPSEFTWYGEYLLYSKVIDLIPIEPMFKHYHYGEQYTEDKNNGVTEAKLAENFLGVVLQSNWGAPLTYE